MYLIVYLVGCLSVRFNVCVCCCMCLFVCLVCVFICVFVLLLELTIECVRVRVCAFVWTRDCAADCLSGYL